MRRISTGVEQLLTTEEVADAVLTYAGILARVGTADTVTVPIMTAEGHRDHARLLLGPASQITIVPADDEDVRELPGADDTVADLVERGRRLEPGPVVAEDQNDENDLESSFPDFGDL
jgi:hypothetical protein